MITIREFGKEDTEGVIAFEKELRRQEPDTYFSQRLAVFGYELFHVGVCSLELFGLRLVKFFLCQILYVCRLTEEGIVKRDDVAVRPVVCL